MWYPIAFLAVWPLLIYYWTVRILFGRIPARTTVILTLLGIGLFLLCFFCGSAITFGYKHPDYWYAMDFSEQFGWWDHQFPEDSSPLYFVIAGPYKFAIFAAWVMCHILWNYFTLGYAFAYSLGAFTFYHWCSAAISCRRMRNPSWGFGCDKEMKRFRQILGVKES